MVRRLSALVFRLLAALAIALFFAAYGYHDHNPDPHGGPSIYVAPSVTEALRRAWTTLRDTILGHHLQAMYWGVHWSDVLISLRLIGLAGLLALLFGTGLAVLQARSRFAVIRQTVETVCGWLEAVPDAMYVIVTVVITLILLLDVGWQVPIFPDGKPNFLQTLVPTTALGVPAGLYMWRTLSLQLADEDSAEYVRTAYSKGVSRRRTFYWHIFPNVWRAFSRGLSGAMGMILSSAIFAEFYLSYQGALFHFTDALGWNMTTGTVGEQKLVGVPSYQTGLAFELTALLILCAGVLSLFTVIGRDRTELPMYAAPRGRAQPGWLWTGVAMIAAVLVLGTFPQLLTSASPTHTQLIDLSNLSGPPFGPSAQHPLGQDDFGRDLLARTLYATWPTLLPVFVITMLSVTLGLLGAAVCTVAPSGGVRRTATWLAETMASLPVLPLVFMALYDRNYKASDTVQTIQFVGWLTVFVVGRSVVSFRSAIEGWQRFGFTEGVESVGRGRAAMLITHLRSWLSEYTVEYAFSEFARVTSLITVLAAMHLYVVERWGYLPFMVPSTMGFVGGQLNWMQMVGDATTNMAYATYPYLIYGPLAELLLVTVGANFIAKGLRSVRGAR